MHGPFARRVIAIAMGFGLLVPLAHATDEGFAKVMLISDTLGNNAGRLCAGASGPLRAADVGCPSYAPSVTTAGDVSVTGNLSAAQFIGDGSLLTGISGGGDRITSGTSNVIVNTNGAISFTTAGSQRMVIDSSGNVGVGTSAPGAPFEVYSVPTASANARAQGAAYLNISDVFGLVGVASRTGGNPDMLIGAYGSARSAATDRIVGGYFSINGTESLTVPDISRPLAAALIANNTTTDEDIFVAQDNSSAVFSIKNGGNVGMGTTAPQATLQVSGSLIVSTSAQTTTPSLYVGTNGNVGVGTSGPAKQLTIGSPGSTQAIGEASAGWGSIWLGQTGSLTNSNYVLTQGGGGTYLNGDQITLTIGNVTNIATFTSTRGVLGNIPLAWSSSSNAQAGSVDVGFSRGAANSIYLGNGTAGDYTGTLIAGNVGIGTTAPAKTLDVSGTARITSNTEVSGTIKLSGIDGEACTPDKYGTMRFNPVTKALQICRK